MSIRGRIVVTTPSTPVKLTRSAVDGGVGLPSVPLTGSRAGAGMSRLSWATTNTRPSISRASWSQPSRAVFSRILGADGSATSITVTITCGVHCPAPHHPKRPTIGCPVPSTAVQRLSCEITVNRLPRRKSDRSSPSTETWLDTARAAAGQALTISTPSPAITNSDRPSVLTISPSSTPATWLFVPEKSALPAAVPEDGASPATSPSRTA